MDTKTIETHSSTLAKAATSNDALSSEKVISLLSELRKGVKASEDLLRSTRVGITVNRLKAHKNPEVARQANELVAKWRQDVRRTTGSSGKSSPTPSHGSPSKTNGTAAANGDANGAKEQKKSTVAPELRNSKTDQVKTAVTGNSIRDNCLRLMYDGLAFMSELAPTAILTVATAVEAAAYTAYAPETSEAYKTKMRSLFQNLKSKSNPQLRVRVAAGEIAPARFVSMTSEELKSAERRAEEGAMHKENLREAMVAQEERSISTSLRCGKCGQRKVSYSQAQTRSADEPMTTFCECQVCGNRWKFS